MRLCLPKYEQRPLPLPKIVMRNEPCERELRLECLRRERRTYRTMTAQLDFLGGAGGLRKTADDLTAGFRYERELIDPDDETTLLARTPMMPFREFEFHGYTGKRRVVSFGWH